jgi:adenosylcobinamide-phosphate synthase
MQRTWNTKLIQFQHFGKPVHLMMNWIQWPTARLLGFVILLLSAGKNTTLFIRLTSKQFWQSSPHYLLHCFALANGIKLGGAIIYLKQKQRRIVINDVGRQPERIDVLKINVFLKSFIIAMTLGYIVIIMLQWLSQSTNLH